MIFLTQDNEEVEVAPGEEEEARQMGLQKSFSFMDDKGEEILVPESEVEDAARLGLRAVPNARHGDSQISPLEAAGRGFASSASLGFADEIAGAGKAAYQKLMGNEEEKEQSFTDLYKRERDAYRLRNEQAADRHGKAYASGYGGGLFVTPGASLVKGGAHAAKYLTGAGAAAGVGGGGGLGQADLTAGEYGKLAGQAAVGGALGGVMGKGIKSFQKSSTQKMVDWQMKKRFREKLRDMDIPPTLQFKIQKEIVEKGKNVDDFIKKHNIKGKTKSELSKRLKPLQKSINQAKAYSKPAGDTLNQYLKTGIPLAAEGVGTAMIGLPFAAFRAARSGISKGMASMPRQTASSVADSITSGKLRKPKASDEEEQAIYDEINQRNPQY